MDIPKPATIRIGGGKSQGHIRARIYGGGGPSEAACGHNYFERKIIEGSNEYFFFLK